MKNLNSKRTRRLAAFAFAGAVGFSGVMQATTSASDAQVSGVWTVESGQWLGRIVAALEANPAKRLQLMEQIVFQNPQAFINADPNRMLAGAKLTLPAATEVAETSLSKTPAPPNLMVVAETVTEAERIGRITSARGQLTATGENGTVRSLRRRSYVRQGDTLTTGKKGGAQVKFNDGAQIALRKDSTLRIDEYRWQGNQNGEEKAVLSLLKGGFRTITGAIGKLNKANYRVNSPYATIGIRGTHYALMTCQAGSCAGLSGGDAPEDGLYGGTAFGAIIIDESHVIEPQQYFHHDGNSFRALMGPPAFLFGSDTQVGDASGSGEVPNDQGQTSEGGEITGEKADAGGFAAGGGTESGQIIAQAPHAIPGQGDDGVFVLGDDEAAQEAIQSGSSLGGQSGGLAFN
ncbi:MAG: FecR domain-containing protein, partial [Immundisolibacteraceae bacterium]|nr:FecR domain-containing protein [Immundisolibacteraceae bacterium]